MTGLQTRREFLRTTGAGALTAAGGISASAVPGKKDRPNVLFLMTDEQHYRSLSLTGNPYIETPNMDRIAREGALFDNATCVTPYCSPSRASIVTGVYPHRHEILLNVSPNRNQQKPLSPDAFPSTEVALHEAGYAMGHRGKWHLGDKGPWPGYEARAYAAKTNAEYGRFLQKHLPREQFAENTDPGRYLQRPVEKIPAIREGWQAFHDIPNNGVAYIATIGRTVVPPDLLPETQITNQVIDLIDTHAEDNFMITASWHPPHDLWVMPEPYYSLVDRDTIELPGTRGLPEWDQRHPSKKLGDIMGPEGIREYAAIYHAMVKYIDDEIGRVLAKLESLGLADNTLVVFTTDHGDMAGAHGCIGKSIRSFFDDLVRIPLAMRLPGRIKPGTVVHHPVSQIDYMPTILDYAGQPIPEDIHGQSMRPLIEGQDVPWRDYAFCQRAARSRMLRTAQWKYATGAAGMLALYDLENDPHEDHNLARETKYADVVRRMHRRLGEVMEADGDPYRAKMPDDPLT